MKKYYVYVHTCPNGKRYVGITTASKPERRWLKGKGYDHQLFGKAVRKYGWSSITHEVFEVESEEEMYRKEIELISFYHSNDPEYGYNCSTGGESGSSGCRYSEEHRKKLSEAQKKVHSDPEYRRKLSEALKGKPNPHSEEHKRHIAEANKERCSDPEVRRKISEAGKRVQKKVHSDPEYRKKISEGNKKKWADPEYKKRVSEARKKRFNDPEVRKNLSEAQKKKWLDPEYREKILEARKDKPRNPHSEEAKKKMSEAAKKKYSDHPEYRKHISEAHKGKPLSVETRKKISEAHKGKPLPRIKIKLPDGTILEITKQTLGRNYIKKGKEFEYVS